MIAIPNMSKPKVCHECIAFRYEQGDYEPDVYCEITKEELFDATAIPTDCPLIEIDLVRCGECKWGNQDNEGTLWCEHAIGGIMKPTDFCSYGERRTDGDI